MASMVQSQLLVPPVMRDRADALALVLDRPRAEILRLALEGAGISGVEETYAAELEALALLAHTMGMSKNELARRATEDKIKLRDLEGRKRYPTRRPQA